MKRCVAIAMRCALWAACLIAGHASAAGQESQNESPIRYRRVYAPADRIEDWPRGAERYIPIAPDDFEELVESASSKDGAGHEPPQAHISRAEYRGKLEESGALTGTARLAVVRLAGAARVRLDHCNLAISQARWDDQSDATLGIDAKGALVLATPADGELQFKWSLAPASREQKGRFAFDIPAGVLTTFVLDLPNNVVPRVSDGVAIRGEEQAGRTSWRIELGGRHTFELLLEPAVSAGETQPTALVRASHSYECAARGLDLQTSFTIDVSERALTEFAVELDPGLQLVAARLEDSPVAWFAEEVDGKTRVTFRFDAPVVGHGRVLRLTAIAPVTVDADWRLPRIRAINVAWQEATATLLAPSPFSIRSLKLDGCRQTRVGALPAPLAGEAIDFQFFSPDASIELRISRRPEEIVAHVGFSATLHNQGIDGRMLADLDLDEGARFSIEAELAERWVVDAVDSVPSGGVSDWSVTTSNDRRVLSIQLRRPLVTGGSIRLAVDLRSTVSPLGRTLTAAEVTPLVWRGATVAEQLVALNAEAPYALMWNDAGGAVRLEYERLPQSQQSLLEERPEGFVVALDPFKPAMWRISLFTRKALFDARLHTSALVAKGRLEESYRFELNPRGRKIDRVLLQFSAARPEPLNWNIPELTIGAWTARRASAKADARGETWEVALNEPLDRPITLIASRRTAWDGVKDISLPVAPDAASQTGVVHVRAAGDEAIDIRRQGVALIEPATIVDPPHDLRVAFRYQTTNDGSLPAGAAITLAPGKAGSLSALWAWSCRIRSTFDVEGEAHHRATYLIESSGSASETIRLPDDATFHGAWANGEPLKFRTDTREILFQPRREQKLSTVVVAFSTAESLPGLISNTSSPVLACSFPVLRTQWTVALPPGNAVLSGSSAPEENTFAEWRRRLFGPLARPTVGALRESAPWGLRGRAAFSNLSDTSASAESAEIEKWCARLGASYRSATEEPTRARWGAVLAGTTPSRSDDRLWLDAVALSDSTISPDDLLSVTQDANVTPEELGRSILRGANLVFIVDSDRVILTTAEEAAIHRRWLVPLGKSQLAWRRIGEGHRDLSAGKLMTVEQWMDSAAEIHSPGAAFSNSSIEAPLTWTIRRFDVTGATPTTIWLTRDSIARATPWMVAALLIAAAYVFAWFRPAYGVLAISISMAAALMAPAGAWPFTSGAFLGTFVWLVVSLIPPAWRWRAPHPEQRESKTAEFAVATVASIAIVFTAGVALGQQPGAAATATTYQVFIPTDDDGKPTGGRYLAPEQLLTELRSRAQRSALPGGWLLTDARYEGSLGRGGDASPLVLQDFVAEFQLRTFAPGVQASIAIDPAETNLKSDEAMLNDEPCELRWHAGEKRFHVLIPEPGRHTLRVPLRPTVVDEPTQSQISLAIPPLPSATLRLASIADGPAITVVGAMGQRIDTSVEGSLQVELGPTPRLLVTWPRQAVTLDKLVWLKIQPGSVTLDATFAARGGSRLVDRLILEADDNLRLLPAADDALSPFLPPNILGSSPDRPGKTQYEFRLVEPTAEVRTLKCSFLVTGVSGVGRVRAPQIDLIGAEVAGEWIAISVDDDLDHDLLTPDEEDRVAVSEFLNKWGSAVDSPLAVKELTDSRPITVATRPRTPTVSADQSLQVSCRAGGADVVFFANVRIADGYTFQHVIDAPPDMRIERVSVVEQDVERTARFGRDADGRVTIFLATPAVSTQRVTLVGWVPAKDGDTVSVPRMRLRNVELSSDEIAILRQPDVLTEIVSTNGLSAKEIESILGPPASGRQVAAFTPSASDYSAEIKMTPNRPRVGGEQTIVLRSDGNLWEAELRLNLQVDGGVLDELRFAVPQEWTRPFNVSPPATHELVEIAGENRRELVIRPSRAISGEYQLTVSGPLVFRTGQPPAAPRIAPAFASDLNQLVVLPTQAGVRQIEWNTRNLTPAPLPEGITSAPIAPESFAAYRVTAPDAAATLRPAPSVPRAARSTLCDVHIRYQPSGAYQGLAIFDVDLAGRQDCMLKMPPNTELIQVLIDSLPATLERRDSEHWRIQLHRRRLPCRVTVIFAGQGEAMSSVPGRNLTVEAPSLQEVAIARTTWTVSGKNLPSRYRPPEGTATTLVHSEQHRILAAADMLGAGFEIAESTPVESSAWQAAWIRRFKIALDNVRTEALLSNDAGASQLRQSVANAESSLQEFIDRAGDAAAPPTAVFDSAAVGVRSLFEGVDAIRSGTWGKQNRLTLQQQPSNYFVLFARWFLGVLAVWAGASIARRWDHREWIDGAVQWARALGVAFGVAWWLWLTPSIVGLAIVAVCLLSGVMFGWRANEPTSVHRPARLA